MNNSELLKEILKDPHLNEKYDITYKYIENSSDGDPRFKKEIIQLIKDIIADNDNHLSATKSYNKMKNLLNIA